MADVFRLFLFDIAGSLNELEGKLSQIQVAKHSVYMRLVNVRLHWKLNQQPNV